MDASDHVNPELTQRAQVAFRGPKNSPEDAFNSFGDHGDPFGGIVDDVSQTGSWIFRQVLPLADQRLPLEQLLNMAMAIAEAPIATAFNSREALGTVDSFGCEFDELRQVHFKALFRIAFLCCL